jgi:hypothetical protein
MSYNRNKSITNPILEVTESSIDSGKDIIASHDTEQIITINSIIFMFTFIMAYHIYLATQDEKNYLDENKKNYLDEKKNNILLYKVLFAIILWIFIWTIISSILFYFTDTDPKVSFWIATGPNIPIYFSIGVVSVVVICLIIYLLIDNDASTSGT